MKSWNRSTVILRCFIFCFFGGIGCLFPFLPLHMRDVGLTTYEAHAVSIVAPLIAALGPLLVSPLADRLAGTRGYSTQKLLAVSVLLTAVSYPLLMCIPVVRRSTGLEPGVKLNCGPGGAVLLQQCCHEPSCSAWPEKSTGVMKLSHCHYDCDSVDLPFGGDMPENTTEMEYEDTDIPVEPPDINPELSEDQYKDQDEDAEEYEEEIEDQEGGEGEDEEEEEEEGKGDGVESIGSDGERRKRHVIPASNDIPPHLCFVNDKNQTSCHVYTKSSEEFVFNATLLPSANSEGYCEKWCEYKVEGDFYCRIPSEMVKGMGHSSCQVVCDVLDPYSSKDSALKQSQCNTGTGHEGVTFWSYLLVRSVADIFPTTAIGLLDAAIIVATRETNLGCGDVGRELAFGSLGFAVFAPVVGALNDLVIPGSPPFMLAFILFIILMVVAGLILIFTYSIPLTQPEWWSRHSSVVPFGGLRRHLGELVCFICILVILGSLWSGIDSYLTWHLEEKGSSKFLVGLTITAGALPAIPLLWYSERVVDYCGHTNLLIIAFIFYIVRYTAYSCMAVAWWALASEALEVFTMSLLWVTVILYMRHLVPRHLTVTGQGMAVLFHFCLGRCIGAVCGAVIVTYTEKENSLVRVYQVGAVVSAIVATLYFIIYHCCLKYCCRTVAGKNTQERPEVTQGPVSNGVYTPLHVYNNEKGRKGHSDH